MVSDVFVPHTRADNFATASSHRIGESVKPMTKGKLSAYAGPIEKIFSPAHVTFTFSHLADIHEHVIKDKVCWRVMSFVSF